MARSISKRILQPKIFAFYDVSGSVKFWGRRGVVLGGVFGFALGVAFAAIPFTSDVLTFGVIGTLIVAAVEGAVIAGAFAAGIAAFYGKGELYSNRIRSGRAASPAPSPQTWPDADIGAKAAASYPHAPALMAEPTVTEAALSARQWIGTIDAWENGSTGP